MPNFYGADEPICEHASDVQVLCHCLHPSIQQEGILHYAGPKYAQRRSLMQFYLSLSSSAFAMGTRHMQKFLEECHKIPF